MQLIVKDHTTGQLSMFAADEKKAKGLDVQAKERQKRKPKSVVATCPQQNGRSRDQAGAAFGVSGRKRFVTRVTNLKSGPATWPPRTTKDSNDD